MNIPPTLILGGNSFIGSRLLAAYRRVHPRTLGTTRRAHQAGLAYLDFEAPDLSTLPLEDYRAAIIAAAESRVVPCQRDPAASARVNVTGTIRLLEQLFAHGLLPIFLSTDYVFDGTTTTGYDDEAPRCPCTVYGQQKAAVEEFLQRSGRPFLALRLSKCYGVERGDKSLLDEMATQLHEGKMYAAAHDQVFCPTFVHDLAPAIMALQSLGLTGMLNVCCPQPWSRYDLAVAVARHLGLGAERVTSIALADLPGDFQRPRRTVLVPRRLTEATSVRFTTVEEALPTLARQYER